VVESVKAASDIYAPIDGTVVEAHSDLAGEPETVNQDPEGRGWFVKLKPSNPGQIDALMDRPAYEAFLDTL
jgi:glycine cleavage system H protein